MPHFFDYLHKIYNCKLYQLIIFVSNSKKPKKKENILNRAIIWPISVKQDIVNSDIKY